MKGKYVKRCLMSALLAAALVLMAALSPVSTMAATTVDVGRSCTLRLNVGSTEQFKDLETATLHVNLYRIANITKNGRFTPAPGYENVGIPEDNEITTKGWTAVAEQASKVIGIPYGDYEGKENILEPTYVFNMKNGGSTGQIQTGLYLVHVDNVKTEHHEYSFLPYLISVPNNLYFVADENGNLGVNGEDEWIYDNIEIGLKPQQNPRFGKLTIEKELLTYNASLGPASFVFQVDAYIDGVIVYSHVVSLRFDQPGELRAVLDDIPAGSEVHVREIYSSPSYKIVEGQNGYTIVLNDENNEEGSVHFTNDYNGKRISQTSVVNHFEYDGTGWQWAQQPDNHTEETENAGNQENQNNQNNQNNQ